MLNGTNAEAKHVAEGRPTRACVILSLLVCLLSSLCAYLLLVARVEPQKVTGRRSDPAVGVHVVCGRGAYPFGRSTVYRFDPSGAGTGPLG